MDLQALPDHLNTKVLAAVNETGNRLSENRKLIKQWMQYQTHLPVDKYDERIIDRFLRGCKHNLDRTKSKLDMYFTCRAIYPQLFSHRDPFNPALEEAFDNFNIVPLPKLTSDGYRVTLLRYAKSDATKLDILDALKLIFMVADIRTIEEVPIAGDIMLFDVGLFTTTHFAKTLTPWLKYALHCAQEGYPQRVQGIHVFNASPLVERVNVFVKQFLKEKVRNRFYVHANHTTLFDYVPATHLPQDYGGHLQPTSEFCDFWKKKLKSYQSYFEQQEGVVANEILRPNKREENSEMFGFEGAFRRLDID